MTLRELLLALLNNEADGKLTLDSELTIEGADGWFSVESFRIKPNGDVELVPETPLIEKENGTDAPAKL